MMLDIVNFFSGIAIYVLSLVLFIFFIVRVVKMASRTVDQQQAAKAARPPAPPVHRCQGTRFCGICGYPMARQY